MRVCRDCGGVVSRLRVRRCRRCHATWKSRRWRAARQARATFGGVRTHRVQALADRLFPKRWEVQRC